MKKIVILGIGNTLMMDDGIGVYLVNKLSMHQLICNYEIEFIIGEADVNYCFEVVKLTSNLIVIDAAILGKEPGEVTFIPFDAIKSQNNGWFSHDDHLLSEMDNFAGINGFLIAIEPYLIDYNIGLSEVLNAKFSEIIDIIATQINNYYQKKRINQS